MQLNIWTNIFWFKSSFSSIVFLIFRVQNLSLANHILLLDHKLTI
jgi:hypothetical protein